MFSGKWSRKVTFGQRVELGVDAAGPSAIKTFLVDDRESRKAASNMDISLIGRLGFLRFLPTSPCVNALQGTRLF